ncbi:SRP54-type protein [Globomyces pollinis-pini]|nr:SRP54-type protein [Globomyces pollinis-pini]
MLESVVIVNHGGLILWSRTFINHIPIINNLIQNIIIPDNKLNITIIDQYAIKWLSFNHYLIIIIHSKVLSLSYIPNLLSSIQNYLLNNNLNNDFDNYYNSILNQLESDKTIKQPRTFKESSKFVNSLEGSKSIDSSNGQMSPKGSKKVPAPYQKKVKPNTQTKGKGKELRSWDASGAAITQNEKSKDLDFSSSSVDDLGVSEDLIGNSLGNKLSDGSYETLELDGPEEPLKPQSSLFSFFTSLTTGKPLTEQDLVNPLVKMKEHLVLKNVAEPIATHLCTTVSKALVGRKLGQLTSIDSIIQKEMEANLSKILTPGSSTNILNEIQISKSKREPYTMVFVGVNGVGKSTNLSKICFWLLQNKLSVLIAACDTFRSGAVEQLKVHCRNLSALEQGSRITLFDRGYGKDPAGIAKEAIAFGKSEGYDVVLIDTAGRMQDNEPLMRALAKLVAMNNPNKIIFVGEALVGNESVDQLSKFNQSLKDFSGLANPRQIDGIVLSKFDTIDDKVGAALSMTYVTGKPILFVGTGQTYTDLRRMNVRSIVHTLLAKHQ